MHISYILKYKEVLNTSCILNRPTCFHVVSVPDVKLPLFNKMNVNSVMDNTK